MLSQMISVHTFTLHLFQTQFNTVLPLKANLSTFSTMSMEVEVMQTPDGAIKDFGAPSNNT
jgi:hypothetical protein